MNHDIRSQARRIKLILALLAFGIMSVGCQLQAESCLQQLEKLMRPQIGLYFEPMASAFQALAPATRAAYLKKIKPLIEELPLETTGFSLIHPHKTLTAVGRFLMGKNKRDRQRYDLFSFFLERERVDALIVKAFTIDGRLSKIESRALTLMVERNYWYNVQWKTFSVGAWFFHGVGLSRWIGLMGGRTPFAERYIRGRASLVGLMGGLIKSVPAFRTTSYRSLRGLLTQMPTRKEAAAELEKLIATYEHAADGSYVSQRELTNLKLLYASLTSKESTAKLEKDLDAIISAGPRSHLRNVFGEIVPEIVLIAARKGSIIHDRLMYWIWELSLVAASIYTVYTFINNDNANNDERASANDVTAAPSANDPVSLGEREKAKYWMAPQYLIEKGVLKVGEKVLYSFDADLVSGINFLRLENDVRVPIK